MYKFMISYDLSNCSPNQHNKFKKLICDLNGFEQTANVTPSGIKTKLPGSTLVYTGPQPESKVIQLLKQVAEQCGIEKYNFATGPCATVTITKSN